MKDPESSGITVIELLVVVSAITVLLAVGVPKFKDFAIRARVSEGAAVASAAQQAMHDTCMSNPSAKIHGLDEAGFNFEPSKHVAEVLMSADCAKHRLWVGIVTRDTGAYDDPFLTYIVLPSQSGRNFDWVCRLVRGQPEHAPSECRASGI